MSKWAWGSVIAVLVFGGCAPAPLLKWEQIGAGWSTPATAAALLWRGYGTIAVESAAEKFRGSFEVDRFGERQARFDLYAPWGARVAALGWNGDSVAITGQNDYTILCHTNRKLNNSSFPFAADFTFEQFIRILLGESVFDFPAGDPDSVTSGLRGMQTAHFTAQNAGRIKLRWDSKGFYDLVCRSFDESFFVTATQYESGVWHRVSGADNRGNKISIRYEQVKPYQDGNR